MVQGLITSSDQRIADIAEKASKEIAYHLERSSDLVIRLGDGSEQSHERMQQALNELWPYTAELQDSTDEYEQLVQHGILPSAKSISTQWSEHVQATLRQATLKMPEQPGFQRGGKQGRHSEELGYILAEMQFLQRAYPDASW